MIVQEQSAPCKTHRLPPPPVKRFLDHLFVDCGLGEYLAQDRGVRALGDTVHAACAVVAEVDGKLGGDVAEVAERRSPGGDQ